MSGVRVGSKIIILFVEVCGSADVCHVRGGERNYDPLAKRTQHESYVLVARSLPSGAYPPIAAEVRVSPKTFTVVPPSWRQERGIIGEKTRFGRVSLAITVIGFVEGRETLKTIFARN